MSCQRAGESDRVRRSSLTTVLIAICVCFAVAGCTEGKKTLTKAEKDAQFENSFVEGTPDPHVDFPEEAYAQAKEFKTARKMNSAEKVLLSKMDQAKKSSVGTTRLGKYLVRLNNVLFDQGKDEEAIKYGEIALKIFTNQPIEKRPLAPWFVNIHSYLGMSYERTGDFKSAQKNLLQAVQNASGAPQAEVSKDWMRLIYLRLAEVYMKQEQTDKEWKVREMLAKKYGVPLPPKPKKSDKKEKTAKSDKRNKSKKKKTKQG